MNRRSFLGFLGSIGAAAAVAPQQLLALTEKPDAETPVLLEARDYSAEVFQIDSQSHAEEITQWGDTCRRYRVVGYTVTIGLYGIHDFSVGEEASITCMVGKFKHAISGRCAGTRHGLDSDRGPTTTVVLERPAFPLNAINNAAI